MYSSRNYPYLHHEGQKKLWGEGVQKEAISMGGGVASQGLFSGSSKIGELLETTSWASVEQATVYQLLTFKRRLTVFIDDLFLMGIPNQVGKKSQKFQGGGNSRGWGSKAQVPCMYVGCMDIFWNYSLSR